MSPTLASELSGKSVVSTDGQEIGELHMLTFHPDTGELETLIVNTEHSELFGIQEQDDGRIHLPASVMKAVRDQLIIEPPRQR